MTNPLKLIILSFSLLFVFSCADEELGPVVTFDTAGKGAYVRLVEVTSPVDYDLAKFNTTSYDYRVEFVDVEKGNKIEQYEVKVGYQDNTPDNGNVSKSQVVIKSFTKSDFTVNENGNPGVTVSFKLSEVASLLGISESEMSGADFVTFAASVTTDDGDTFSAANSSAAVNGAAFKSHFAWTVKLNCPLEDSQFSGTYVLSYVQGGDSPVGGVKVFGEEGQEFNVEVVSKTKRRITVTYIPDLGIGNTAVPLNFEFVCTIVVPDNNQGSGLRCGSGILFGQPRGPELATFDLNDDSSFDLALIEDVTNDCGAGSNFVIMRFTKK